MQTTLLKLSQLRVNDANPRQITEEKFASLVDSVLSLPKMLEIRPVVTDDNGVILGGNMRFRALTAIAAMTPAGIEKRLRSMLTVKAKSEAEQDALVRYWSDWLNDPTAAVIRASSLTEAERREFVIKDNVSGGSWDWDALANEWDDKLLDEWGVDIPMEDDDDEDEKDDAYTRKVDAPTYTPSGTKPEFSEMYDTTKRDELIEQIKGKDLPDDVRRFLIDAAYRHTVFNYEKIADYYAQAPADVQDLMERSALVIIDYDKAIEYGFVKLTADLAEAYRREHGITDEKAISIEEISDSDDEE